VSPLSAVAFMLERDLSMSVGHRVVPAPRPDEALVRVEWAGLCGSDLHVMRTGEWVADWPATLGHEIFGRIEQAPPDSRLAPGRPVVADSRIPCAECTTCRAGQPDACAHIAFVGEARPGGFASHCVLPLALLHEVPDELEGSRAVLAEPLAVALHAVSHVGGAPARAAILGHGPIGALLHIELRRRFPATEIEVAEPAPVRAALARAVGARCAGSSGELEPGGFDLVLDAAGYPGSLRDAVALCRHGGELVIVALSEHEVPVRPMELVEKGLRITGSNAFRGELPVAISLLEDEGWRYEPVVTDVIDLEDLPDTARRELERPDAVKVLVHP
jgi:threonine dehydrogenase-like Zn-dependent dehydrogenase